MQTVLFNPRRILCPVDFGELSMLALKYAAAGARTFGAELVVLHVVQPDVPPYFTRAQIDILRRQWRSAEARILAYLKTYLRRGLGPGLKDLQVRPVVKESSPAAGIVDAIRDEKPDLVVMGTHGRSGVKRFLLGSVTETVIRNAQTPVFVVRQKEHDFVDPGDPASVPLLRKLLCPVNSAGTADAGLAVAAALARRFDATLTVLNVIEPGGSKTVAEAKRTMCAWITPGIRAQCAILPQVKRGEAAQEIIRFAAETAQDLIVLPAPARHRLNTQLFGSTTEVVLRNAPTPVLIVPIRA